MKIDDTYIDEISRPKLIFLTVKSRLENFQIGKLNLAVKTVVALGNFQAECHWAKALTRGPTNGELSEALFQAGKSLFSNAGGLLLDVDNKYDGHEVLYYVTL